MAFLTYRCIHGTAPTYLADELLQPADLGIRTRPTIGADHITAGPPYTAVDCRRPSFSSRRCPYLERPAAPRHVRIISACFPKLSEDAPFPALFFVTFVQCL